MQGEHVYVEVLAEFSPEGKLKPLQIVWEDGVKYTVDRITDVRPVSSLKAGGSGTRYTCMISGRQSYLYRDGDRWYVERKRQN